MPLYHIHTQKRISLRLYTKRGQIRPRAIRRFSRFLRSYRTDEVHPIHWRLAVILYEVWLHFGQPQVTIFSGYRPSKVVRLKTSKHVSGEAVDFALDGISNARLRDYLLKHWFMVGVGYYPNSYHVHLDVRKKKAFWIDYGGPGESAMYARKPYRDLRKGLAKRGYRPSRFAKKKEQTQRKKQLARKKKTKQSPKKQRPKSPVANRAKKQKSRRRPKPKSPDPQLADATRK
jgi:uncharacterized protein YcbK (DUF882 family)